MSQELTILVISDVHSNLQALDAVLKDAEKYHPDVKINAGDLVGYGPQPCEVIKRVQDAGFISVIGNHDRVASNIHSCRSPGVDLNTHALDAAHYTGHALDTESADYLHSLRAIPYVDSQGRFAVVHGSFDWGPEKLPDDTYIDSVNSTYSALLRLFFNDTELYGSYSGHVTLGVFGHSHIPTFASGWFYTPPNLNESEIKNCKFEYFNSFHEPPRESIIFNLSSPPVRTADKSDITYSPKVLFNPGSVGQPRNGSPRACYGIIHITPTALGFDFKSVVYNFVETQRLMRDARLPEPLITRLAHGN